LPFLADNGFLPNLHNLNDRLKQISDQAQKKQVDFADADGVF